MSDVWYVYVCVCMCVCVCVCVCMCVCVCVCCVVLPYCYSGASGTLLSKPFRIPKLRIRQDWQVHTHNTLTDTLTRIHAYIHLTYTHTHTYTHTYIHTQRTHSKPTHSMNE